MKTSCIEEEVFRQAKATVAAAMPALEKRLRREIAIDWYMAMIICGVSDRAILDVMKRMNEPRTRHELRFRKARMREIGKIPPKRSLVRRT